MQKGIKLVQWNLRSICPTSNNTKLDELRYILQNPWDKCHVLCITETWLNDSYQNKDIAISGYHPPERCDRSNKSGGGVAIYVIDGYDFRRCDDLETPNIESVWIEIKPTNSKPLLVCTVYRPPDAAVEQWLTDFETQVETAYASQAHILVMGDLNINMQIHSNERDKLSSSMGAYAMSQMIEQPTRCTANIETLIDHVWTTEPETIRECRVQQVGLSDHYPTCVVVNGKTNKNQHISINYRSFKNFDMESFNKDIDECPWSVIDVFDNVNDVLSTWHSMLMDILNKHAPMKEKRVKRKWQPGWMTDEIIECMKTRDYHKKKNEDQLYRTWRNKCVNLIRSAKQTYYAQLVENCHGDTRKLWGYMKELSPAPASNLPTKLENGDSDPTSIANQLNDFFIDVVNKFIPTERRAYDSSLLDRFAEQNNAGGSLFEIPKLTVTETEKMLQDISENKSTGIDGIPPKILKKAAKSLAPSICKIINLAIESGTFPDQWKSAKVTPIHKGGSTTDTSNFRPVSVLCAISKIVERHIHDKLYAHTKKFLHQAQSGFRKNYSCETALSRIIDIWTANMDAQLMNGVVLLDLRKAFDLIDHTILLEKLQKYDVGPRTLSLLESYLCERQQQVHFKGALSDVRQVRSGVPQGSIVGPLLFILYMNDLPLVINRETNIDMYADDATITFAAKALSDIECKLNDDLNSINNWCINNRMAINTKKTKAMLITTAQRRKGLTSEPSITLNGDKLEHVTHERLLGVVVDQDLLWKEQVDAVCLKLSRNISLLRRIKPYLDETLRRMFYMAYIQPHTDYCLTVWGMSHHVSRVRKLQNIALRVIADEPPRTSSLPLFKRLRVMPIGERVKYKMTAITYKALHEVAPDYICDMFSYVSDTHTRTTRASTNGDLSLPNAKLKLRRNALSYQGAKLYNDCDTNIRNAGTIKTFKQRYYKQCFLNM